MKAVFILFAISTLVACGSGDSNNGSNNGANNGSNNNGEKKIVVVPETYSFESRFGAGSSASYTGQTFRQLLISDLGSYIGNLNEDIDTQKFSPSEEGQVVKALDTYFRFDSATSGAEKFLFSTELPTKQTVYDDISSGKDLVGKLAGNDSVTDHKDWSTEFKGWSDSTLTEQGGTNTSPEGLIIAMFETLEKQAIDRVNGTIPEGPNGAMLPVHVTSTGLDLKQLSQKLLLMGITFSQATDDYLDDDVDGKGLLSPNTRDEEKSYTKLEHAWDEGFGYFGAAADYSTYTDEQIADKENIDTNSDGSIDMKVEHNWGASVNAGKRDKGSTTKLDFTKEILSAFLAGRTLIANADEVLTEKELTDLKGYRDVIVTTWERVIAATIIHYINENVVMIDAVGTDAYDFIEHAKIWSELKGFSLGLQFNPRSPMNSEFENLHSLLGDLLPTTSEGLKSARALMETTYGFDSQDVENW